MVSGHSYLPNDSDFAKVETAKKRHDNVYIPQQWMDIVAEANRKKPFNVIPMCSEDFIGVSDYKKELVIRKRDTGGRKEEWLKIQWIRLVSESPSLMYFKYNLTDITEWNVLDLAKRQSRGRPANGVALLNRLHDQPVLINPLKLKDINDLLDYVPPVYHDFYKNLRSSADQDLDEMLPDEADHENEND